MNKRPDEATPFTATKYNLRRYNKRRHELLIRIPEPPKAFDEKEIALQQRITDAMRIDTNCFTGNINVSLFWEEKYLIIMRVIQLYSFFFLTYYEFWPASARSGFTGFFSFFLLSFNVWNQENYY